jgi:nucleotide-binding universal stress UspA family protein
MKASFAQILAATDFSDSATCALVHARKFAKRFGSRLSLLHADGLLVHAKEGSPQFKAIESAVQEYRSQHLGDFPEATTLLSAEPAADAILNAVRNLNADLIVMGTRGRTGVARVLLGSTAEKVIRHTTRPVLTTKPCDLHQVDRSPVARILCPVNYTNVGRSAFDYAVSVAEHFKAELLVLYIIERASTDSLGTEIDRLTEWAGDVPKSVLLRLLIERGEAAQMVLSYGEQKEIDLLIIGGQRRQSRNVTVLGSTTEALTRSAPWPVLMVPVA